MRKRQKRAAMFARVDEWERSGKSVREFANALGVSKSGFAYWIRKRHESELKARTFIELTPNNNSDVHPEACSKYPDTDGQSQIVITFPSGLSVKICG